jgi:CubicO group peptidase (beta-lactamase class C family)
MLNRRELLAAPLAFGLMSSSIARGESRRSDFPARVRGIMTANQVPGLAIAIVENGRLSFAEGFGVRSIEGADRVDADTLFRVGSIAEPFTALTMLRLVDSGRVRLEAPVSTYLPGLRANGAMTIAQLLSHTAGLADHTGGPASERRPTMASYAASPLSLAWEPGRWFSYSNPGYSLAGAVVEAVSGASFEAEAQETIDRLGLERATFDLGRAITRPHSVSHSLREGRPAVVRPEPLDRYRADTAAGMMFASARDLGRFAEWLIAGPGAEGLISPAAFQQMKEPRGNLPPIQFSYGLGLRLHGMGAAPVIGHGGNIPGNSATVHVVPSRGFGVAVLSNIDGASFVQEILDAALEQFAGLASPPPVPAPVDPDHVGIYEQIAIDGAIRRHEIVRTEEGGIERRAANGRSEVWGAPFRRDAYRRQASYLVFLRDASQRVVGMNAGSRHWQKVPRA